MTTSAVPPLATSTSATSATGAVAPTTPPLKLPIPNICKAAHATLGKGYNSLTGALSDVRILQSTADENVDVSDVRFSDRTQVVSYQARYGHNDKTSVNVNGDLKVEFSIHPFPWLNLKFNPGASLGAGYTDKDEASSKTYLGTVRRICFFIAKYGFVCVPSVNKEINPTTLDNGRYTGSGLVYAGYIVDVAVLGKKKEASETFNRKGNIELSIIKDALSLGAQDSREGHDFADKKIMHLEVRAEGFGFPFPTEFFSEDPEKFVEAMNRTHRRFLEVLPDLIPLRDFNPARDTFPLINFSSNRSNHSSPAVGVPTASTSIRGLTPVESWPGQEMHLAFYEEFVSEMWKLFPEGYRTTLQNVLGKYRLPDLLWTINRVFPGTLEEINLFEQHTQSSKTTIVYGDEGVGKSLLIGVLLGAGLKKNKKHTLDLHPRNSEIRLPVVGHLDAQTTGASVYKGSSEYAYVDTQGLGKTAGEGANLCGAPAIHAMVRACQPQRVMLVIGPGAFENRAKVFFKQMKLLGKVIDVVRGFSSVLVVVNDHTVKINRATGEPWSEADIEMQIQNAIDTLKSQLEKRIPNLRDVLSRVRDMWRSGTGNLEDPEQDEAKESAEEVYVQIHLLEQLLERKNFVYTNLTDSSPFISEIEEWQRNSPSLSLCQFHMDRLAGERGFSTFQQILTAVAEYYLRVHGILEDINKQKTRNQEQLKSVIGQMETLSRGAQNKEELAAIKREKEGHLMSKRTENQARMSEIQLEIDGNVEREGLTQTIERLRSSRELKAIKHLVPRDTPTPRSIFAIFDGWAQTYDFPLNEISPLVCGFELRKVTGDYFVVKKNTSGKKEEHPLVAGLPYAALDKIKGVESIRFRPAFFDHEEDREATLTLLCLTKDHPNLETEEIAPIHERRELLTREKIRLSNEIQDLTREVRTLIAAIQSEDQRVEELRRLGEDKTRLEHELQNEEQNEKNAKARSNKYDRFRVLVQDILKTFYQYSPQTMNMDPSHVTRFLRLANPTNSPSTT